MGKNRAKRKAEQRTLMNAAAAQPQIKNAYQKPDKATIASIILGAGSAVNNGLNEALFPAGIGYDQNVAFGQQQVSKSNTLYSNLRGYMVSNMRQLLSESYVELGLVQNVCRVPVEDAFRGGIDILTQQIKPEQIKELKAVMMREGDISILMDTITWTRLFGGGGTVILCDQDPEQPFDIKKLNKDTPLEFKAADLWELFYDKMNVEGFNPAINDVQLDYYSYYGHKTHRSRVMKMKGLTAPSFVRPRLRGWGFSVLEGLIRSINQHLKAVDLIFELLDEAKLDVYGLKNLADTLLMQGGDQMVRQRVALANKQKNFQNALVLDSEDTYNQKELSFQGIADIMKEIRIQVASDMRIPLIKLFGVAAEGMNASSKEELEVYHGMIESDVREKAKYQVIRIVELRCQQLFGIIPTDIEIEFKPLQTLSEVEEESVKTQVFARVFQARQAGEISSLQFVEACNADKLLPLQIDTTLIKLNPDEAMSTPDDVTSGTTPAFGGDEITGTTDGPNRSESETEEPVVNHRK